MSRMAQRNVFDLSHRRKMSCDMGLLIPHLVEEVIPGDTFKVKTDLFLRLSPLVAPMMHQVDVYTHYFFVPNRLIWEDWEDFITGGRNADQEPEPPYVSSGTGWDIGSVFDYLGFPTDVAGIECSALPLRAYQLVWQEWYRDRNIQDPVTIDLTDGSDTTTGTTLQRRCWQKDYFTSSLPWQQRGDGISVNIGGTAPVTGSASVAGNFYQVLATVGTLEPPSTIHPLRPSTSSGPGDYLANPNHADNFDSPDPSTDTIIANVPLQTINSSGTITGTADLSSADPISINDLRLSFQLQKWLELSARTGSRYRELLIGYFGVRSSDARMDVPEYLGGGRSPISISEVLQTESSDASTPQGTMSGHGFSAQQSHAFKKSFEEHGWIIGIVSIMPKAVYQQGIRRSFSRKTRYEYPWPQFAHIGEQAVLRKEVYADGSGDDDNVFGYVPMYEEMRRGINSVHGDFRDTLKIWHMARIWEGSAPVLNSDFVTCNPTKRVFAVESEDVCWIDLLHNITAVRPIARYGEPGIKSM